MTNQPTLGLLFSQGVAVLSFVREGRSKPESFPRRRESTPQTFSNALSMRWIPAFAGMTCVSKSILFQMTPAPRAKVDFLSHIGHAGDSVGNCH
jgi:hypothetical protein